ncbi:hypothetical protein TVAG_330180 [Trichomonas vaginalis G3]|uniref:Uncharacterized protein n=1 Tax=Trichomonas vaginalis (strain ATCC PRA-98 / G3) TaxID=412133 RepID=A2GRR1_TRIV3|nr:hypothetical protein TVAGG3_0870130 [Trichomonas vaginalis G3]EAX80156.1 hypothetical protein TVAG_330180 [Trichomonas vaginalis G3]KAI5501299.1 hypothetical protein TVAGG3_0870130 [Trichomonas vaginalis G3]|eukprot:XP_001293086.1 hypothetical protein [Trichomonas vaginalis G3]
MRCLLNWLDVAFTGYVERLTRVVKETLENLYNSWNWTLSVWKLYPRTLGKELEKSFSFGVLYVVVGCPVWYLNWNSGFNFDFQRTSSRQPTVNKLAFYILPEEVFNKLVNLN